MYVCSKLMSKSLLSLDPGLGYIQDQIGELSARRRRRHRRRRRRHLEIRVDILAGELYLEFSNWNLTHMRDIWIPRLGFYTEFPAESI